jgi:hypothetical protein
VSAGCQPALAADGSIKLPDIGFFKEDELVGDRSEKADLIVESKLKAFDVHHQCSLFAALRYCHLIVSR